MNYGKIVYYDTGNAKGLSIVLFVSGCEHYCSGCFNSELWDFQSGKVFSEKEEHEILKKVKDEHINNFIFSGGDPFNSKNINKILELCQKIKKERDINIIVYTGYTIEEIKKIKEYEKILSYVNIIIDGKYDKNLPTKTLDYRGSINQKAWKKYGKDFVNISKEYFKEVATV